MPENMQSPSLQAYIMTYYCLTKPSTVSTMENFRLLQIAAKLPQVALVSDLTPILWVKFFKDQSETFQKAVIQQVVPFLKKL